MEEFSPWNLKMLFYWSSSDSKYFRCDIRGKVHLKTCFDRNVEPCHLLQRPCSWLHPSYLWVLLSIIRRFIGYQWSVFNLLGVVSVVELKQSSVMQRLLIGWMPTAIRWVVSGREIKRPKNFTFLRGSAPVSASSLAPRQIKSMLERTQIRTSHPVWGEPYSRAHFVWDWPSWPQRVVDWVYILPVSSSAPCPDIPNQFCVILEVFDH